MRDARVWLATTCIVLLVALGITVYLGGETTTQVVPVSPLPVEILGMSCPSSSHCVAIGLATVDDHRPRRDIAVVSTNTGRSWTYYDIGTDRETGLQAISCPTTRHCIVVGSGSTRHVPQNKSVYTSTDGGRTWSAHPFPTADDAADAVSCASELNCVAVGNNASLRGNILVSMNGGASWNLTYQSRTPGLTSAPRAVSCPSSLLCVAGGGDSQEILVSKDGGWKWSSYALQSAAQLRLFTCPTTRRCVGIGTLLGSKTTAAETVVLLSTSAGLSWRTVKLPVESTQLVAGLSCYESTCVMTAPSGGSSEYFFFSSNYGSTWSTSATAKPSYVVTCATKSVCLATTASRHQPLTVVSRNGGASWSSS